MERLTPNFTLAELTRSATAQRLGLDNTPPPEVIDNLYAVAHMLEAIRDHLTGLRGRPVPIIVTSGYRSPAVNRAVGSRSTSDHPRGQAADFVAPAFGTPAQVASALAPHVSVLGIGQLIYEAIGGKEWVHVAKPLPVKTINRVITISDAGTFPGIRAAA